MAIVRCGIFRLAWLSFPHTNKSQTAGVVSEGLGRILDLRVGIANDETCIVVGFLQVRRGYGFEDGEDVVDFCHGI